MSKIPSPKVLPETQAYWSAANEGRLSIKFCCSCETFHHYPRDVCPHCLSVDTEWKTAAGTGTVRVKNNASGSSTTLGGGVAARRKASGDADMLEREQQSKDYRGVDARAEISANKRSARLDCTAPAGFIASSSGLTAQWFLRPP